MATTVGRQQRHDEFFSSPHHHDRTLFSARQAPSHQQGDFSSSADNHLRDHHGTTWNHYQEQQQYRDSPSEQSFLLLDRRRDGTMERPDNASPLSWFQRYYFDQARPVLFEKDLELASVQDSQICDGLAWSHIGKFLRHEVIVFSSDILTPEEGRCYVERNKLSFKHFTPKIFGTAPLVILKIYRHYK